MDKYPKTKSLLVSDFSQLLDVRYVYLHNLLLM